jgi:hypothetical protein
MKLSIPRDRQTPRRFGRGSKTSKYRRADAALLGGEGAIS